MAKKPDKPEIPRVEPEIIPPDRAHSDWRQPVWQSGTQRIYVGRVGPFGAGMFLLAFALLMAVIVVAVVGAVLIWIPLIALAVVAAGIFRFLRR
jgi:hypothetical protein